MRVELLIDRRSLGGREVTPELGRGENPGVGGAVFVTLQLLDRLAHIEGVEAHSIVVDVAADHETDPSAITVAPMGLAVGLGPQWRDRPLVVVVHHPHDHTRIAAVQRRLKPAVFVSVGRYAHHSNRTAGGRHLWVPNPFPRWALRERTAPAGPPRVFGFVGALDPAKGFHHIAHAWPAIRRRIPEAQLEVIGSASLYGRTDVEGPVPTTGPYARRILRALGDDRDSVTFHGLVGRGKADLMAGWDVALLNPTGLSEADPSSLKEAIAAGIPPVAAMDYGMWDLMRHFPALVLRRPRDLPRLVGGLSSDPGSLDDFRQRRDEVLARELERDDALADRWVRLLEEVAAGADRFHVPTAFVPERPAGRIGRRLVLRRTPGLRGIPDRVRRWRGLAVNVMERVRQQ